MIRRLTEAEQEMARTVFGDAVALDAVRLIGAPWPFDRAFVAGRWFGRDWIVWPRLTLPQDFSATPLRLQATFIHEMTHVWQAQTGVNLLLAKLRAGDGAAAYAYPLDTADFDRLNIEQQASVIEHRFRLARGGQAPCDAAFYDRLCPFPAPQTIV